MNVPENKQHTENLAIEGLAEIEAAVFDARLEADSANGVFDALIEKLE